MLVFWCFLSNKPFMQGEVSTPRNTDGWDSVELKEQKGMNYFVPPLLKATDEIKA